MPFPTKVSQQTLWDSFFRNHYRADPRAERIWRASQVRTRHGVAIPPHVDVSGWGTEARMRLYLQEAVPLAKQALTTALNRAGLHADQIGMIVVASCTGYATPGLDVLLARDLGMAPDTQRLVLGHMGCAAALPGLGAVADYVTARNRPAVLVCVELTTLHVQPSLDNHGPLSTYRA